MMVVYMINKEKILEELLIQACASPHQRPKFLEDLLNAQIYCLGKTEGDVIEEKLVEGSHVELMQFQDENGEAYIPFFTSLEKLQKAIHEEQSYLKISTESLFQLTLGTQLVLNPYSEYGKVFTPQEVEKLLNGNYGSFIESYEYKEDTEILLSQPFQYPHEMVNELKKLLEIIPQVKAAYLAQMHDPQRDPEPTLLIGFETAPLDEIKFQRIKNQIGHVAYESLLEKRLIDLMHLDENNALEGVSKYLKQHTQPFYVKPKEKKKSFFAKLFS